MATKQATIANDISGQDGLWHQATTKLAEDVPHYANKKDGKPNYYQITTAAKNLGHDEVNAGNLAQVIQELKDRVNAPDPAPTPDNGHEPEPEPEPPAADPEAEAELVAACERLPEAPMSVNVRFVSRAGLDYQFTMRSGLPPELARLAMRNLALQIQLFEEGAAKLGWGPHNGYRPAATTAPATATAAPPVAGAPVPPPAQSGNGGGEAQSGTAPLNRITVDADGKVEFHVGRFRYPFKDARGAEVVAGLFDTDLGWTAAHFVPGAKYENEVNGLQVDWQKPGKYYDVVKVHR